jgi:hypothetical protein
MGDAGEVAKAVIKLIETGEKIAEEIDDHSEKERQQRFRQEWERACAEGDTDALNRLLHQLR